METYKRKPNFNCKICNKYIYKRPSEIEKGHVYCSQECYGKSCTILIQCLNCGADLKSGLNKNTCNRECSNKLRIGSKYKTGRPSKDKVKTRKALKIRLIDLKGSSCEKCKYPNTKILEVHHIIRQCDGGSDELDNLQLICPNCHAEEHYDKN
jgi:5-methylcytosine-specific restriction endonuclease McrA